MIQKKRPAAYYKSFDITVELNDKTCRAIVIHSSAHDKRRHKRIDKLLKKKKIANRVEYLPHEKKFKFFLHEVRKVGFLFNIFSKLLANSF